MMGQGRGTHEVYSVFTAAEAGDKIAFHKLIGLGQNGDEEAQWALVSMYYSGQGVPVDLIQAAMWFRKGADQGEIHCQFFLGGMYLKGNGVAKDFSMAAMWFRKGAEQG